VRLLFSIEAACFGMHDFLRKLPATPNALSLCVFSPLNFRRHSEAPSPPHFLVPQHYNSQLQCEDCFIRAAALQPQATAAVPQWVADHALDATEACMAILGVPQIILRGGSLPVSARARPGPHR